MILRAMEQSLPWSATQRMLQQLLVALAQFDVKGARDILLETIAEYRPSSDLVDLVWGARQATVSHEPSPPMGADGKVTSLRPRRGSTGTT
jgi:hypothetical protein